MTFQIDKPGRYRQRDDGMTRIVYIEDGAAFGFGPDGTHDSWFAETGRSMENCESEWDIVAEWHDPPTPPDGFEIRDRDYVAQDGDMMRDCDRDWWSVSSYVGWTIERMDRECRMHAPHYIASPIPKPFRISDHGFGIYETRDGSERRIVKRRPTNWRGHVYEWHDEILFSYRDDGVNCHEEPNACHDIVRYIGPLEPEKPQEQWEPTCELRFRLAHSFNYPYEDRVRWVTMGLVSAPGSEIGSNELRYVLEQRWTCNDSEQWRPVRVTDVK